MLERTARLAIHAPRRVIAIAVLIMIGTAVFGIPVAKSLSAGGFENPNSESQRATNLLANKLHQGDLPMLITVTSNDGAQSSAARTVATDIVRQLHNSPYVAQVTSPWTASPSASASLISKDGKTGLIVAGITGGENDAPKHAKVLSDTLVHDRDGVTVRAGGDAITYAQVIDQTEKDLNLMEAIAIPLSFLVLVWVFGGLVAAALPIAVGGLAVFGSMAVLRAVSFVTEVSIFALNLLVAMGLALAIDYTLLILSRFRDEVADGVEAGQGAGAHDGRCRPDRAVLGDDGRAVDVDAGALSDVFAEVVRLCRHRGGGVRGHCRDCGNAGAHRAARRPTRGADAQADNVGRTPDSADVLVPVSQVCDAPGCPDRPGGCRADADARHTVLRCQVGLPRRSRATDIGLGASGRRSAAHRFQ